MAPPRALLALAVFCAALAAARAIAPTGNCDLLYGDNPISDSGWTGFLNVTMYVGNLKDDRDPGVYLTLNTRDVTEMNIDSPSSYIDVVLDAGASTLSLVITEAFEGYEEDMISASDASLIDVEVTLTCSDGNTANIVFKTTVEDVNNHAPAFEQPSYEYDLPMPLPAEFSLSCLVGVITVQDIDISNSAITVEFDEQGSQLFSAVTRYQQNRNYAVELYSKAAIELKETTSFTITALDNGVPQLRSDPPTTITIKVNQETSPPTAPRFEKPAVHQTVRTEDIVAGNEIASLTILEGYGADVAVSHTTLDDEGLTPPVDKFIVVPAEGATAGAGTVSLRWADGVTAEDVQDLKYALIVVEAKRERGISTSQITTTVVHLSLPGLEDQPTTACPSCPSTAEPTPCPEPEPCTSTAEPTPCPEPEPSEPCPTTAEPCECPSTAEPTPCPEPEPSEPCPTTSEPRECPSTVEPTPCPDCPQCSTTAEPTTCPTSCPTDPTCPTTQYPLCNSSDVTEPCICPAPSECTPVDTTSPGSPPDCSQCPATECPPTSPDTGSTTDCSQCPTTECPTTCPDSSPTTPYTGSTPDCSQCPATECPPTSPDTGSSTGPNECPTTCPPCESCPTTVSTSTTTALPIGFEEEVYSISKDSGFQGPLLDLKLKDGGAPEDYQLQCQLEATDDVLSRVGVAAVGADTCRLTADPFLVPGSFSFFVVASLVGTSSAATAKVALSVSAIAQCDDSAPYFPYALQVLSLRENPEAPTTLLSIGDLIDGAACSIRHSVEPKNYEGWVTVDKGEVLVSDLDYEKVTSLVISLTVSCESEQQQQLLTSRDMFRKDQPEWPRDLLFDVATMTVLLQIQDVNDNPPVFTAGDRLVVGYPTGDLLERVQPGPVVTLTATDADEGENAELRYSLDAAGSERFTVQAETGAVYLRADAPALPAGGASFTATVANPPGPQGTLSDTIQVQVKPLGSEELVMVTTVEGALPEDADTVVANLSDATGLVVRLLRAYPAVAASEDYRSRPEDARGHVRAIRAEDSGEALTLLLYALDDQETLVSVDQFQKLLSSSEFDLPWKVSRVPNLPSEAGGQDPTDVTGYMAAIITLAVLIAVAVVGVAAGYYFYFRPRMGVQKQKGGDTEFTSVPDKLSPLESQVPRITTTIEPNISTVSEIIEPVNQLTAEKNIHMHENSNGVLAPDSEDDWSRKRSVTIRGGPDDYNDTEGHGGSRRSESSDSLDGDGAHAESEQRKSSLDEDEARAEAERRKSTVHFNENVECIEVDRL